MIYKLHQQGLYFFKVDFQTAMEQDGQAFHFACMPDNKHEPCSQCFNSKQRNLFRCTIKTRNKSPIEANRVDTVVVSLNPNGLVVRLTSIQRQKATRKSEFASKKTDSISRSFQFKRATMLVSLGFVANIQERRIKHAIFLIFLLSIFAM